VLGGIGDGEALPSRIGDGEALPSRIGDGEALPSRIGDGEALPSHIGDALHHTHYITLLSLIHCTSLCTFFLQKNVSSHIISFTLLTFLGAVCQPIGHLSVAFGWQTAPKNVHALHNVKYWTLVQS